MRRVVLVLAFALTLISIAVPTAAAQTANNCPAGDTPHFVFGFADLRARIGDSMGGAITCEFSDPQGTGDVHQSTNNGLAFWRKATNTPTFTNGSEHWALSSRGLLYWQGSSIDPPTNAIVARPTMPQQTKPLAAAAPVDGAFTFAVIESPGLDTQFWCLKANPSCARDKWWMEWNEVQSDQLVEYRFIGPGFATERRFVEVVWLLWQWPEGKTLLHAAADSGVTVASGADSSAFATFSPRTHGIRVNTTFTEASTWMVTDVIAHELKHASDIGAGLYNTNSFNDCITREQRSYAVEQRFLRWISARFDGLPSHAQVASGLSTEDLQLYDNLYLMANSPDVAAQALNDYRKHC